MTYRVGILGATGAVGQTFVRLLAEHPWFEVTALAASERSAGQSYGEAASWLGDQPMPPAVAELPVEECAPPLDCDVVFSGLSSSVAGDIERTFAEAGYPVISNAKNYRMQEDVPLLVPEINPDHASLIEQQSWGDASSGNGAVAGGFIVTNPNCSTVGLVCVLGPLADAFGLEAVQVTTLQALSGAGYPGVPSLDALGNAIPYIGGEEKKMATEPLKILGALDAGTVEPARVAISAQCNRVAVIDGHLETVSVKLEEPAEPEAVAGALQQFVPATAEMDLPTAPETFIHVFGDDAPAAPQPRRHAGLGGGMTVSVGRVRSCAVLDVKMAVLSHNTVRGAAGGALLNAELLAKKGYLQPRHEHA